MTRKEIYDTLTENEKKAFLFGAMIYNDDILNRCEDFTFEQANKLSNNTLEAILLYIINDDNIDLDPNSIALSTAKICVNVLEKRENINYNLNVSSKWEEFIKRYNTEVSN